MATYALLLISCSSFLLLCLRLGNCTDELKAKVYPSCNAITDIDLFDKCHDREAEKASYKDLKKNLVKNISSKESFQQCPDSVPDICDNVFKAQRIRGKNFQVKIQVQISDMIYKCCGPCGKYYVENTTAFNSLDLKPGKSFDIRFPVTARSAAVSQLYGYYYIPVLEIPGAYYFTLGKSRKQLSLDLIWACLNVWPLFLVCILLSFIFGFIMWILERRNNGQFSEKFPRGCFQGFWWSWITMSTVGYGDKTPRSVAGRLFAVACILVGITTFATYTALVTSSTLSVYALPDTRIAGKEVGALANRIHDSIMIEQHGGIIQNVNTSSIVQGVFELIRRLKRGSIDGYLINKASHRFFKRVLLNPKNQRKKDEYDGLVYGVHLHRSEKRFLKDRLVTGMMVKDEEIYQFFHTYFESNWLKIQGCFSDNINADETLHDEPNYYSLHDGMFLPFLYCALALLTAFVLFGVVSEIKRKKASHEEAQLNVS